MGCFSFHLTATVMLLSILLLVTTPVLSFLKFLVSIRLVQLFVVKFPLAQLCFQARDCPALLFNLGRIFTRRDAMVKLLLAIRRNFCINSFNQLLRAQFSTFRCLHKQLRIFVSHIIITSHNKLRSNRKFLSS